MIVSMYVNNNLAEINLSKVFTFLRTNMAVSESVLNNIIFYRKRQRNKVTYYSEINN